MRVCDPPMLAFNGDNAFKMPFVMHIRKQRKALKKNVGEQKIFD